MVSPAGMIHDMNVVGMGMTMTILDVNADNVDDLGFFCYMSKRKSEGYQRKLEWLKDRFSEGLRIKMLELPDRGFIEYMPGEQAWRGVNADGWMVIHCLWVVGKSKKQGYAKALLEACVDDARKAGKHGVAVVTSEGNWLISKKFFVKQGWECVATAAPSFSLLVKRFDDAPDPSFVGGWTEKQAAQPDGLTVFRTDQCPYIVDAVQVSVDTAAKAGVACNVVELTSSEQVKVLSPSPFGVYGMTLNGCMLSYHYQLEKDLLPQLTDR
ncbi:GNAT family N-acetyltransferase [bacterium]|nr:GNAT family N-acetyltransferase [bacterium]